MFKVLTPTQENRAQTRFVTLIFSIFRDRLSDSNLDFTQVRQLCDFIRSEGVKMTQTEVRQAISLVKGVKLSETGILHTLEEHFGLSMIKLRRFHLIRYSEGDVCLRAPTDRPFEDARHSHVVFRLHHSHAFRRRNKLFDALAHSQRGLHYVADQCYSAGGATTNSPSIRDS